MRSAVLSLTMMTALAVTPALAQTTTGQPGLSQEGYPQNDMSAGGESAGAPMGEMPAPPSRQPMSRRATNINQGNTHSIISPSLPPTGLGSNATATDYLAVADSALSRNRTGAAQAALENAETYLLNRSVPQGTANQPDQSPAVQTISNALQSLAAGDRRRTRELVRQAMQEAQQAQVGMQSGMQPAAGMNPGMSAGPVDMGGAGYPPGPGMQPGPAPRMGAYPPPPPGAENPPPPPR